MVQHGEAFCFSRRGDFPTSSNKRPWLPWRRGWPNAHWRKKADCRTKTRLVTFETNCCKSEIERGDSTVFCRNLLRCPETLFISHENANFLFSVFRMVEVEAKKTPKIMGCCRAIFAFLPALKIGTFGGKWTSEWMFKASLFVRLAFYFWNQQ